MKHAGKEAVRPSVKRRMVKAIDRTGKEGIIQIMRQLEPGLTRREAAKAYDMVTAAINGWLMAYTKHVPKGTHYKLLLANCFSLNICWHRGEPGKYPDYLKLWLQVGDRLGKPGPRAQLRAQRLREWQRFRQSNG